MGTYISGVQISDMTLNNVALPIALSGAEIMLLHCWEKTLLVFL